MIGSGFNHASPNILGLKAPLYSAPRIGKSWASRIRRRLRGCIWSRRFVAGEETRGVLEIINTNDVQIVISGFSLNTTKFNMYGHDFLLTADKTKDDLVAGKIDGTSVEEYLKESIFGKEQCMFYFISYSWLNYLIYSKF